MSVDDLLMELCRLQRLFKVPSQPVVLRRMRSPTNFRKPGNGQVVIEEKLMGYDDANWTYLSRCRRAGASD